jgi:hypothetical protein
VRQIRRLRLTIPSPRALPCASGAFLGGSQGGAGMPPPGYAERSAPGGSPGPTGFGAAPRVRAAFGTGRFFAEADFAIFS